MAAASSRSPQSWQGRLQDLLRRRRRRRTRACGRSRRDATIYVLNGLHAGLGAGLRRRSICGRSSTASTELAEWDAFVATSSWRGGAALHVDTGMNRLGITVDEAARIAPRLQSESHGFTLLMSHSPAPRRPTTRSTTGRSGCFAKSACLSRRAVLARQFVRNFPRRHRALRSGAAGRGALRRQSDARASEPDAAGGRAQGPHHPGAHGRQGRDRRLWRRPGPPRGRAALRWSRSATRTAILRPASASNGKPAAEVDRRRQALPARRPRFDGSVRASTSPTLPDGTVRRGDLATLIGDGMSVDDLAAAHGHDRLRDAHQPRPALSSRLKGRVSRSVCAS